MLLPATLFGLRGSMDRASRRLVADRILRTLLRHDLTCTVPSLSRHVQHLLGDDDKGRRGAATVSKERDRQSAVCKAGRRYE